MTHAETIYIVSNAIGWAAFIAIAWMAGTRPGPRSAWLPAAAIGVLLALGRWPVMFYPQELNIDESQMIAQAMKYGIAPVPWLHVDGTTSGPVNSYWLILPSLLGMPFGYPAARMMGLVCVWLFLCFSFLTARAYVSTRAGLLLCAPFLAFLAFIRDSEFIHYSSEHVPIALVSAEVYFCARIVGGRDVRNRDRWIVAMLAGAIPFTKLQATPIAASLAMLAIAFDMARARRLPAAGIGARSIRGALMAYGIGVAVPVVLILGPVAAAGSLRDFWISYVRFGAAYGEGVGNRWGILLQLLQSIPRFAWFAGTMVAVSGAFVLVALVLRSLDNRGVPAVLIAVVSSASTLLAVVIPGRPYPHYMLLLLIPLTCLVLAAVVVSGAGNWRKQKTVEILGAVACLAFVINALVSRQSELRSWLDAARYRLGPSAVSEPARTIAARAMPGDVMAIWGWEPRLYVETGLPPGTRDSVTFGALAGGPYRDYYLCRYVFDMEHWRPRFFLDVVRTGAFTFNDRATSGHEQFAQLETLIRTRYTSAGEIGEPGAGYRLYQLNDVDSSTRSDPAGDSSASMCSGD